MIRLMQKVLKGLGKMAQVAGLAIYCIISKKKK